MAHLKNDTSSTTGQQISSVKTASPSEVTGFKKERSLNSRSQPWGVMSVLRVLLLDLPLMLIFAAYVTVLVIEKVNEEYLTPQLKLMEWTEERRETEITSYHYVCTEKDITATSADELIIHENMSKQEAVEHMQVHGASMYPDILSNVTADELRAFVLEANQQEEGFWVIEGEKRFSFGVKVDHHPSVAKALKEIAFHPVLRPALDAIVGENPAIFEFTAITSVYGARQQFIHQDVLPEGSAAKYARSFIPSYSLFIPLQDTSEAMGATELCPGTQICSTDCEEICEEHGFPASGSRDKWPKGWGALVNQQVTHRGTAHSDPDGPERVVFILTFAPRPQFNDNPGAVETRQIGKGGSYSLQYMHYGHTLDDFGRSTVAMQEPFRSLRSLGLYKPSKAQWGWDMITVASMRISYGDNGYNRETLEEFVEGGGFPFLPKFLQAKIIDEDYDEDVEPSGGWYSFLVDTLQLVKTGLARLNQAILGVYLVGLFLLVIMNIALGNNREAGKKFIGRIGRLTFSHTLVASLALLYFHRLSQTQWARHIKTGKLYQPYDYDLEDESENFAGVTLPNMNDVLIGSHLQSRYLASYSDILDFNIPGNKVWRDHLNRVEGFDAMTQAMQDHFCKDMIQWLRQERGRLLVQREMGQWRELKGAEATKFCYKQSLAKSNALMKALIQEIEFLKSETKFGSWRRMVIHQKTIPKHLASLEEKLIGCRSKERCLSCTTHVRASAISLVDDPVPLPFVIPQSRTSYANRLLALDRTRSVFPPKPKIMEPFKGAWLEIGDDVEGKYQGFHNEWYRGTLIYASADRNLYDVTYDDGEEDFGLCRRCVRPFKPFRIGEKVEVRFDDEDGFVPATIEDVHADDLYDIILVEDGEYVEDVATTHIRRFR